jgi:hypothetical protein
LTQQICLNVIIADKLNTRMPGRPNKEGSDPADNRRSQRILLQIPILVRAQFEDDLPIKEDTRTLEVNAHGALIALAMRVRPGQKLTLRNWATAKEQDCRVVHVREIPGGKNEVGVAFPYGMPRFWNVQFPPPDWTPFME